jgi:hypothetical protein
MHWLLLGMALLVAVGIIAIGTQYIASPRAATRIFGLPLPEDGTKSPGGFASRGCETSYRG